MFKIILFIFGGFFCVFLFCCNYFILPFLFLCFFTPTIISIEKNKEKIYSLLIFSSILAGMVISLCFFFLVMKDNRGLAIFLLSFSALPFSSFVFSVIIGKKKSSSFLIFGCFLAFILWTLSPALLCEIPEEEVFKSSLFFGYLLGSSFYLSSYVSEP